MITAQTTEEEALELGRTECNGCTHCCKYGSGYVLKREVASLASAMELPEDEFISKYLEEVELFNTKHYKFKTINLGKPYGSCVFLSDKGCRIHNIKPLHCRISTCKEHGEALSRWFMLKYFVNERDPESVRQYALFLKTIKNNTLPGGELNNIVKDKEKLKKMLSYELLK